MRDERETESRGARPRVVPSSALVPNPEYVTLKLAVFATCRVTFVRLPREKKSAFLYNTRVHTHRLPVRDRCESVERSDAGAPRGRGGGAPQSAIAYTPTEH